MASFRTLLHSSLADAHVFERLANFDCNFSSSSTTATLYMVFYQNLFARLVPAPLRDTYFLSINHQFHSYVHSFLANV